MLTFLVFVVVFGGMIFIHEFGHFIVARIFKIPVEEFGFGIPPRAWRFWRSKGHLVIGGQKVVIPANYDLPFDWQDGLHEEANASVDKVGNELVLRTITLTARAKTEQLGQLAPDTSDLALAENYKPELQAELGPRGAISLIGVLSEVEPGMEWTINWLPLGGFVRPRGENDPNVPGGLAAVNPWKRLAVLFAGPFMNLLTAVVVFSIIVAQTGMPVLGSVKISEVTKNSPAEAAGIKENDIVRSINGQAVTEPNEMIKVIRANLDKPVALVLERNGQLVNITVTPLSSRPASQGALGIGMGYPSRPATASEIVTGGFTYTAIQSVGILYLPVGLLQGTIGPDEARFVGLKGIYDMFGSAIQRDTKSRTPVAAPATPPTQGSNNSGNTGSMPAEQPTNYVLLLIAMLSVSLGVFNLMPIPALDGGRILFTLPEIIFRKRIPPRFENTVNGVAFLMLIGLMLVVNVMDFINPANINLP